MSLAPAKAGVTAPLFAAKCLVGCAVPACLGPARPQSPPPQTQPSCPVPSDLTITSGEHAEQQRTTKTGAAEHLKFLALNGYIQLERLDSGKVGDRLLDHSIRFQSDFPRLNMEPKSGSPKRPCAGPLKEAAGPVGVSQN